MGLLALCFVFVVAFAKGLVPPAGSAQKRAPAEILQFEKWLDAHGVERNVVVQDETNVGGGRGLVACRRLEPGQVAAWVPISATLRLEGGLHDENDGEALADTAVTDQMQAHLGWYLDPER